MKRNGTNRFWRSAAQCLLASIAVALLTFFCFRFRVNLTIACLLYLTIVVLLSVTDAIVPSIFVSVISVLCMDYYFAPPLFSLQLNDRSSGIPANDRSSSVCCLLQDRRMYRCRRFGDRYCRDTSGSAFDA
jgi:K+-sensing histidine kinase KdpD